MTELLRLSVVLTADGRWMPEHVAQNGATFTHAEAMRLLCLAAAQLGERPAARILSEAEHVAMVAERVARAEASKIPAGWEATQDGACLTIVGSAQSFSKTFRRVADGAVHEAPVADENGTPTPDTAGVLRAYDEANPVVTPPQE